MKCDLHENFGRLASALSFDERDGFTFTSQTFPELPSLLNTDQLVVRKGHANYDDFRVDRLQYFASKATYLELGLLILSVVFRPGGSRTHLALAAPSSTVKNLVIEYRGSTSRVSGHQTSPQKFVFWPEQIDTHPWTRQNVSDLFGLPRFILTNLKKFAVTEQDWADRDTVIGFGNDDASVRLASLLLSIGSPQNATNEVVLEGEGGFRGVGVHSAEAVFNLPGSLAWPEGVELSGIF